jgi:hypothetical protein
MGVLMRLRCFRFAALALGATLGLAGAGCFNPPKPNCAFLCGDGNACPEDYTCSSADNRCHLVVDNVMATSEDEIPGVDAAAIDAATVDAQIFDAGPDAPPGTPDAHIDAAVPPPDARPIDAALPPDARIIDAALPPDAFVNHAPVLGNVATPVTVVAGTGVTIVVSATDVDPGQTLAFSAPPTGTNRNPYLARAGDAADLPGGAFDIGTHTFTLPAGLLGRFDITFTVDDGHGGTDTALASVVVTAHPVRINEVQLGTTAAARNLEIVNTGASTVNVSGWEIWIDNTSFALPAGTSIAAGDFLVLHADTGTDDANNLFMVAALNALPAANEVALYQTPTTPDLSRFMRDFVKWGAGAGRIDQAFFAGQWPSTAATSFVDTSGVTDFDTVSVARDPGDGSESAAAWYVESAPSFGAANTP